MKKEEPAAPGRGKFGDRKDGGRGPRGPGAGAPRGDGRDARSGDRPDNRPDRPAPDAWREAPRLGDAAFRAQRDALENAQFALKKLAAQAHGEALGQLLTAWEKRDATLLPSAQELGNRATPATRTAWTQALGSPPVAAPKSDTGATALLRLEMAAEVPTPAEHITARRALQLQLLTKRNAPAPDQTWGQDTANVLAGAFEADQARRLQNVLKVLLKR